MPTRRSKICSALPPYLGGKRRLCPLIFREVQVATSTLGLSAPVFFDGFLGGGSVSLYAKALGYRVIAADIATRAITVGRALISNQRVRLTREDLVRLLAPGSGTPGSVERGMVPEIFPSNVARFVDRALEHAAEKSCPHKAALLRLLAIRVAMLTHPMSQVRKGTIHRMAAGEYESITESCVHHYVDSLRLTRMDRLWPIAQQINQGVFPGIAEVHQRSVLDLLPEIEADVAYFDPPYPGVMSYEKEYAVIDEILDGERRPTSPFTAKDGADLIDGLLARAEHIPVWLLSLGNAVVSLGELEEKMARAGRRTKAIALKYQHLPAVATDEKKQQNREFLVIGWREEGRGPR